MQMELQPRSSPAQEYLETFGDVLIRCTSWSKAQETATRLGAARLGDLAMRALCCATLMLIGGLLVTSAAYSSPAHCKSLWIERNLYYKNAGFCFDQPRASRYFGNAGC